MRITFYGDMLEETRELLKAVGKERNHKVVDFDADVIFMIAFPQNMSLVRQAARKASNAIERPVLMLNVTMLKSDEMRELFKTRKVMDIVDCPYSSEATHRLFSALEKGNTGDLP